MKEVETKIDDVADKLVDCLENLGYNQCFSKSICYFVLNKSGEAVEIEHTMGLRQPEVSVGTNCLMDNNLITCEQKKLEGKGRPKYCYIRKKSPEELLQFVVDETKKKIERQESLIAELNAFIKKQEQDKKWIDNLLSK